VVGKLPQSKSSRVEPVNQVPRKSLPRDARQPKIAADPSFRFAVTSVSVPFADKDFIQPIDAFVVAWYRAVVMPCWIDTGLAWS